MADPGVVTGLASTMAASALAGVCARVLMHPVDTIKTLRQNSTAGSVSPAGSARQLVARLYRGVGVAALLHAPAVTVYLSSYDVSKRALGDVLGNRL